MSENVEIIKPFDPFADIGEGTNEGGGGAIVHIRLQQRNGRKTLTTVQGLNAHLDRAKIEKLVRAFKKDFCCNGTIVVHNEWGEVIQLQGDHRSKIQEFLVHEKIIDKDLIKVHGF